jgi:hypothetical protein
MVLFAGASGTFAEPPKIVDGVVVEPVDSDSRSRALTAPAALTSSSIDFDTPKLFSDTLPLQVFQTLRSGVVFFGKGVVLDAESFEVTGTSGTSILAFNGRTAVNGDGSIPRLPEFVLFLRSNRLGLTRRRSVSVDVGSKRDEGRTVRLLAYNNRLRLVDEDSVVVAPHMQTLTVSTATPEIVLIALMGDPELQVLAVDNLLHN